MQWISNRPPLYIWEGDTWKCEHNGNTYDADVARGTWKHGEYEIPFPPKTRILKETHEQTTTEL